MLVVGGSRVDIAIRCQINGTYEIQTRPYHPHYPTINKTLSLDRRILTLFSLVVTNIDGNDTTDLSTAVFPSYPAYLQSTMGVNTSNSESCIQYEIDETQSTSPCYFVYHPRIGEGGVFGVLFIFYFFYFLFFSFVFVLGKNFVRFLSHKTRHTN